MEYKESVIEESLVARCAAAVDQDLAHLVRELNSGSETEDRVFGEFIDTVTGNARARGSGRTMSIIIRLPLLVHAAETGDPFPAKIAALLHVLWWTSARVIDDIADRDDSGYQDRTALGKGIFAALAAGNQIPLRAISAARLSPVVMNQMAGELTTGWLDSIRGQLLDFDERPADATTASVLSRYQKKTGAPYAMAAAMAARLAEIDEHRTGRWRDLGRGFGVLRQLVNDQLDLCANRDEDIANGTATYLLAHLLEPLSGARRSAVLELHSAAAESAAARQELKSQLLAPEVIASYSESVGRMVSQVHESLDDIGGVQVYIDELHALFDEAMSQSPPQFRCSDRRDAA
jgi:geranylgeranyl pyrophosphate synthase